MTDERVNAVNELLAAALLAGVAATWFLAARGLTPGPLAWTLTRVTGVGAYVLLTLTVGLGATLKSRLLPRWLAKPLQYGWHGVLSGFALAFTAVHVAFVTVDAKMPQTLLGVLVPGRASYAPLGLALGTLAAYAAVLVYLTFSLKARMPRRVWLGFHLLAYPSFVLATLHGILAGTDALGPLYLAGTALTTVALLVRMADRRAPVASDPRRAPAGARTQPEPEA